MTSDMASLGKVGDDIAKEGLLLVCRNVFALQMGRLGEGAMDRVVDEATSVIANWAGTDMGTSRNMLGPSSEGQKTNNWHSSGRAQELCCHGHVAPRLTMQFLESDGKLVQTKQIRKAKAEAEELRQEPLYARATSG